MNDNFNQDNNYNYYNNGIDNNQNIPVNPTNKKSQFTKNQKMVLIICFCVLGLVILGGLGFLGWELLSDDSTTDTTPTVAVTEKATEKPTEEPTNKPTEEPTKKPTEKPTEKPTQNNFDKGYIKCSTCKYVHLKGMECPACQYNYSYAKSEVFCDTCGGGYDVGGAVHSAYCLICEKNFVCCRSPYHCLDCGLCYSEYPQDCIRENGYCEDCYEEYSQVLSCVVCDDPLTNEFEANNFCCEYCYENLLFNSCAEYMGSFRWICPHCDSYISYDDIYTPVQSCPNCDEWIIAIGD